MITISPTVLTDGTITPSQPIPANAIKRTFDGTNYIVYEPGDTLPTPAAPSAHDLLVPLAQAQLDIVTGPRGQLARCYIAGAPFSAAWQTYIVALRAIVNGTDPTSTTLPVRPEYIEGT